MNSLVKKGLYCGLFVAGLTLFGTTAAQAQNTTGEDSLLGGGIIEAIVELPVTVLDNAVSVIGDSNVTQAPAPAPVPATPPAPAPVEAPPVETSAPVTNGENSIGGGNQVIPVVSVPITVSGNSITLIGDSSTSGTTTGSSPAVAEADASGAETNGLDSILGGNQILADVLAPITVTGNAITLIGDSSSSGTTAGAPASAGVSSPVTSGLDSILGGNQLLVGLGVPITIGGNAITLIGDSSTTTPATPGGPVNPPNPTEPPDPTTPITPTTPTTPGTPGSAVQVSAVGGSYGLAFTGVDSTMVIAGFVALMLLGLALLFIGRRRSTN